MGKKTVIGGIAAIAVGIASFFTYSTYIGFEKETLAHKIPENALGYASIRHLRKAGFAFATDEQLQATAAIAQAIAKAISDAAAGPEIDSVDIEIDAELLRSLGTHFKTQLAFCALPSVKSSDAIPSFAALSNFYGSEKAFVETLSSIAFQASSEEERYRLIPDTANGYSFHRIEISSEIPAPYTSPFQPCFAIVDEVFYLATEKAALLALLDHNTQSGLSPRASLASKRGLHEPDLFAKGTDFELLLNASSCIQFVNAALEKQLIKQGGFYPTISPKKFFSGLGLDQIDSIYLGLDFNDDQQVYSSLRYNERTGILDCFESSEIASHPFPPNLVNFAADSISLNTNKTLSVLKNATFSAAPLANIPYFAYRTRLLRESKIDLESIITSSFSNGVSLLHTLDTGTNRNRFGKIQERLVYDFAVKFRLQEGHKLEDFFQRELEPIIKANHGTLAYREENRFFVDQEADSSMNANRSAISITSEFLTIGHGTLKTFEILDSREEEYNLPPSTSDTTVHKVGAGVVSMQALPSYLYRIATVYYQQLNPDKGIPSEFYEFDWGSLTILEQNRHSELFDDRDGHLYRISRKY